MSLMKRIAMRVLLVLAVVVGSEWVQSEPAMQAAWVCSVHRLDFPTVSGSGAQRQEIARIVLAAREAGLNALFVQVRPECDALYRSNLEPWSRFLTGTQGVDPGYDPLQVFLEEGAKRGIAIHAWVNPYRAATSLSQPRAASHVTRKLSRHVRRIGSQLWLDPGAPEVQAHVLEVVRDLVRRYPVAGVHLDDYFYPYPVAGYQAAAFPDTESYGRYRASGGQLPVSAWRRANVNAMVRRLSEVVKQERPGAQFGISPFGIYTKGVPSDVQAGLDQLNELYADPVLWLQQGWVDYLAPQLYWRNQSPQSFSTLLRWWRHPSVNPRGIPIVPGIALDRLVSHKWPSSEIALQLDAEKRIGPRAGSGFVLFHVRYLQQNTKGIRQVVVNR